MHDLRVEPVRPGLENSVAFTRAKLFFPVLAAYTSYRLKGWKYCPRPARPEVLLKRGTCLSILGTYCDLPQPEHSGGPFYTRADP